MLRPGLLLALSLTGTSVDTLLRTDFAIRRYPSYEGDLAPPRLDFHQLDNACLWAAAKENTGMTSVTPVPIILLFPSISRLILDRLLINTLYTTFFGPVPMAHAMNYTISVIFISGVKTSISPRPRTNFFA